VSNVPACNLVPPVTVLDFHGGFNVRRSRTMSRWCQGQTKGTVGPPASGAGNVV
jgi:hypothetical protein